MQRCSLLECSGRRPPRVRPSRTLVARAAVRSVMERVNATFNKLLYLPGFEEVDTDTLFTRLEGGFLVRVSTTRNR